MAVSVSVIIPVYNGFDESRLCLESVLRFTPEAQEIIIVDDASPAGDFLAQLPATLTQDPRLKFFRHPQNVGFVASVNFGMEKAGANDVVLLNSDTEVTSDWLKKMTAAAISRKRISTVTALTNNGTIASVPKFCQDNEIPRGYSVDAFADLVESVTRKEYPIIPTAIGSCMYIRREALNEVGLFDAEAFGRGYGEENDFCLRAQAAGFVDILDDATFIYHKGCTSFKGDKVALVEKNSEIIRQRYPHYFDQVGKFCRQNPLHNIQARILDELVLRWSSKCKGNVLEIVQNGPTVARHHPLGGTELHVRDIIETESDFAFWSLVPSPSCYYLTAHMPGLEREYILGLADTALKRILRREFFDLIHLHHSRWMDHIELGEAMIAHGNYVVSFHDYILVCPRFHLLTPDRRVCDGHECTTSCSYDIGYITAYRDVTRRMLEGARRLFCFSESTAQLVKNILRSELPWRKVSHGIVNAQAADQRVLSAHTKPTADNPLRVAFVGFVPQHKGALEIEKLIEHRKLQNSLPIEWHVVGKLFLEAGDKVVQHGTYEPQNFLEILRKVNPHLVAILSICPETYCLTLDEVWNAGIPVISTPFGAPAERVKESGAGWVLNEIKADEIWTLINRISDNWDDYLAKCAQISNTKIRSIHSEAKEYHELYSNSVVTRSSDTVHVMSYLNNFSLRHPPKPGFLGRLSGKVVDKGIYLIEHLKLRPMIERAMYRLFPRKVLEMIKGLRHQL